MYLKEKYMQFKRNIYEKKLNNLLDNYNVYNSINMKAEKLCTSTKLKEIIRKDNRYPIEISKNIILNFVETVLFSEYTNNEITFDKVTLDFIISNRIDKILFDNINMFSDDIKFLNEYKILTNKIISTS